MKTDSETQSKPNGNTLIVIPTVQILASIIDDKKISSFAGQLISANELLAAKYGTTKESLTEVLIDELKRQIK